MVTRFITRGSLSQKQGAYASTMAGHAVDNTTPPRAHAQNGSNCRQVALANVLRLPRVPTAQRIEAVYLAFMRTFFPTEASLLSAQRPMGAHWTLCGGGATCPMTLLVEEERPWCAAVFLSGRVARDAFRAVTNGISVEEAVLADAESLGAVYSSKTHAMGLVRGGHNVWWDIQAARPQRVTAEQAAARMRGAFSVTAILSRKYVSGTLLPRMRAEKWPRLAARLARRCVDDADVRGEDEAVLTAVLQAPTPAHWEPWSRALSDATARWMAWAMRAPPIQEPRESATSAPTQEPRESAVTAPTQEPHESAVSAPTLLPQPSATPPPPPPSVPTTPPYVRAHTPRMGRVSSCNVVPIVVRWGAGPPTVSAEPQKWQRDEFGDGSRLGQP